MAIPKIQEEKLKEEFEIDNIGEFEFGMSAWLGAILLYLFSFGTVPFVQLADEKHIYRNAFIGWLFKMILLVVFLFSIYKLYI